MKRTTSRLIVFAVLLTLLSGCAVSRLVANREEVKPSALQVAEAVFSDAVATLSLVGLAYMVALPSATGDTRDYLERLGPVIERTRLAVQAYGAAVNMAKSTGDLTQLPDPSTVEDLVTWLMRAINGTVEPAQARSTLSLPIYG